LTVLTFSGTLFRRPIADNSIVPEMRMVLVTLATLLLASCGGGGAQAPGAASPVASAASVAGAIWAPASTDRFQWDLLDAPADLSANASVYDIDMFNNAASVVSQLHSLGRRAVCYIDMGGWEPYRPDASQFPASVIGNKDPAWNESYLDIRRLDILGPLMSKRLDQCKSKGFDAVEPDQIETYAAGAAVTGFPLSYGDQISYNRWIADQAHQRGLSVALKNDADQAADLVGTFDWTLLEDCYQQGWCQKMAPFLTAGKSVIDVEYTDVTTQATFVNQYCPQAKAQGVYTILKHRNVDAWLATCP
jgi:Glycoside-hydrolase family GH114